jgi:hypothetical protein
MIAQTFAFVLRLVDSSVRRPAYDAYDTEVAPGTLFGNPLVAIVVSLSLI